MEGGRYLMATLASILNVSSVCFFVLLLIAHFLSTLYQVRVLCFSVPVISLVVPDLKNKFLGSAALERPLCLQRATTILDLVLGTMKLPQKGSPKYFIRTN